MEEIVYSHRRCVPVHVRVSSCVQMGIWVLMS